MIRTSLELLCLLLHSLGLGEKRRILLLLISSRLKWRCVFGLRLLIACNRCWLNDGLQLLLVYVLLSRITNRLLCGEGSLNLLLLLEVELRLKGGVGGLRSV